MAEQKKSTTPSRKSTSTEAKPKAAAAKKAAPKQTAPKKAADPKPRAKKAAAVTVSEEMRQHMIREAAYYRALHRGFGGGAEMDDWCAAEREIDAMLGRLTK
ncbi:DUF2934 domain-containing protein [Sulfurivermis fontis]|uniref:DUF2934 domain-containing protein n=1 Tax=Sulfurivermis fontis TaxID=1972068 RepID=UPI000FDC9843|nr:DUF2934 domain-containing protein [Sulfurivermis fontis]